MLEAIRKRASSIVIKALFLILVLSFVLWGIADVFSPGRGEDWVAKVGDRTISRDAFAQTYQQTLRRFSQAFGEPIGADRARALGVPDTVLNQMITRHLIDQAASDLGIRISDEVVRRTIVAEPLFHNEFDQFDADRFRETLRLSGLTEDGYVAILRGDIARDHLVGSLTIVPAVPAPAAALLHRFRTEQRVAEYVVVPLPPSADIAPPDEAALRAHYQANVESFVRPEQRAVTTIILRAGDLAADIAVDQETLRRLYTEQAARFSRPERRAFEQMVLTDQDQAVDAHSRVAAGEDFAAVAADLLGLAEQDLILTDVARNDLPADLAQVVFSLVPGELGQPVSSTLGWHVVRLVSTRPATQIPFEEVADQLAREFREDHAIESLIVLANRLDDVLGRGATLEQAATELGLPLRSIPALSADGTDAMGHPLDGLPSGFVETAFQTPAQQQSLLRDAEDDVYYVLRVDQVTPQAPRPFEEVQTELRDMWLADRRLRRARDRAETIAEALRGGRALEEVAAEQGLAPQKTPALTRDRGFATDPAAVHLPPPFVPALFDAARGEVFMARGPEGFHVGRVAEIRQPAPEADPAGLEETRRQLAQALEQDLLQQYVAALRQRYPIRVNTDILNRLL